MKIHSADQFQDMAGNNILDSVLTNPMTDAGDIIYGGTSGVPTKLVKGADGQVLKLASGLPTWANESGGGGGTSLWTSIVGTRASNTTITVVGDQTAIFKKGNIVRWKESTVDKVAIVSIPSTFSSVTTITICGDTCASIDTDSFKYSSLLDINQFSKRFAIAGTIGATGNNAACIHFADQPYRFIGIEFYAGVAGTTNSTTVNVVNQNGTVTLASPSLATTVRANAAPTAPATSGLSLALNDAIQINITAVQTTPCVDLYINLLILPTRFLTLS